MGRILVCALFIALFPYSAGATTEEGVTPPQLNPAKTSFAYRARHSVNPLPGIALSALWFAGEDRMLPRDTVAEPIVEVPAHTARHVPSRNALCSHAAVVAAEHNLPAPFFANLIQQESGFKSHVVSPAGAQGIAQFMPRVARAYGLENPFDPVHSMAVSAKFLRELLGQFGNLGLAAAAYNAGPRRVQDWMAKRGKLPEETRNYVRNITGQPAERWARTNAPTEGKMLPAHARCPGMPVMEVSVPEAAPVRLAKIKGKGKGKATQVAEKKATQVAAKKDTAKDEAGDEPKSKSYALAAASPGRKTVVIKNGKIQIIAPEPVAKRGATKVAAKAAAKPAAKGAAKVVAAKEPAKSSTKLAAKSQSKPPGAGKRVKVAAAR